MKRRGVLAGMAACGGFAGWKWTGLTRSCLLIAVCGCGFVLMPGYAGPRGLTSAESTRVLWGNAFTVMHAQAQPLSGWPWIFCYGVSACASLEGGTGLLWLMLVHFAVDTAVYHLGGDRWDWIAALGFFMCVGAAGCGLTQLSEKNAA